MVSLAPPYRPSARRQPCGLRSAAPPRGRYAPFPYRSGPPVLIGDPFAGGSVRGIVAAKLGYAYYGVELSARQVEENRRQASRICRDCLHQPVWIIGDGEDFVRLVRGALERDQRETKLDMLITCPPYYNLEKYNSGPGDLSMLGSYEDFLAKYGRIIANATSLLKEQHFAIFVVRHAIEGRRRVYSHLVC